MSASNSPNLKGWGTNNGYRLKTFWVGDGKTLLNNYCQCQKEDRLDNAGFTVNVTIWASPRLVARLAPMEWSELSADRLRRSAQCHCSRLAEDIATSAHYTNIRISHCPATVPRLADYIILPTC